MPGLSIQTSQMTAGSRGGNTSPIRLPVFRRLCSRTGSRSARYRLNRQRIILTFRPLLALRPASTVIRSRGSRLVLRLRLIRFCLRVRRIWWGWCSGWLWGWGFRLRGCRVRVVGRGRAAVVAAVAQGELDGESGPARRVVGSVLECEQQLRDVRAKWQKWCDTLPLVYRGMSPAEFFDRRAGLLSSATPRDGPVSVRGAEGAVSVGGGRVWWSADQVRERLSLLSRTDP